MAVVTWDQNRGRGAGLAARAGSRVAQHLTLASSQARMEGVKLLFRDSLMTPFVN